MRGCFYFVFILMTAQIWGQNPWAYLDTKYGEVNSFPKNIIPIVDEFTGNTSILVEHPKYSQFCLFDTRQQVLSEVKVEKLNRKAGHFVGSSVLESTYGLVYRNNSNSKFELVYVDYDTQSVEIKTLDLNLKRNYFIESFEDNGKLYLLSIVKNSSVLKLYELNVEGEVKEHTIDLSAETFKKRNGFETTLYYLLTNKEIPSKTLSTSIAYNVPNALEKASAVNKVYYNNEILSLTNDALASHTNLIQVSLKDFEYSYVKIPKKGFEKEELRAESNSFLLDNYVFTAYATTDKLVIGMYDLEVDSYVKEYAINDDEAISIANTSIQDLKRSGRFLKNIVNTNLGISVYQRDSVYVLSLGGSSKEQTGTFAIVGGVVGGLVGAMLLSAFDSYSQTVSTKIDCLFDKNFDHVSGEVSKNGFDRIKEFIELNKMKRAPKQTVFKYGDSYVWGCFYRAPGVYKFYQFDQ